MAGTSKKIFSVSEVLSMLDLDHTQSGSDLDINELYDESEFVISLTLTMIGLPWRNHMKNTCLLMNIWKGMNLYVSRYTHSEDVIQSQ